MISGSYSSVSVPKSITVDPLNDTLQDVYQASHYQFVASALAVKAIHEIDPQAKVGSVIEYKTIYPMSCDPKDSLVVCREKQRGYFFSDVQVRGKYPGYAWEYFKDNDINIEYTDEDMELMQWESKEKKVCLTSNTH